MTCNICGDPKNHDGRAPEEARDAINLQCKVCHLYKEESHKYRNYHHGICISCEEEIDYERRRLSEESE